MPVRSLPSLALVAFALAAGAAAVPPPGATGATSSTQVQLTVSSATAIDIAGCQTDEPGITLLGSVLPGSASVSTDDCVVEFGSTNDSSRLQLYQEDGSGTAMAGPGDRSTTWTSLNTGTINHLRALAALPDGRIWASGYAGTLIHSADGGDTWSSQTNPADDVLRDLYAVDSSVIWGTGWTGNIIRTVNGGATWTQVGKQAPVTGDVRGGVRALDDQTAWVGGSAGRVFKTTNGGASWSTQTTGAPSLFWGMDLVGTSTLWAVGQSGEVAHTTNGGTSWTVQRTVVGEHLYRIDALDANRAVAAGALGLVIHTDDAGATWDVVPTPTTETLDGVVMLTAEHWLVVGFGGTILETRNTGASWQALPSGTTNDLRALWAPDDVSIWVVGESGRGLRAPVNAVDDYDDAGGADFATGGAGFFGACLRSVEAGASTDGSTWVPNAACPASDGNWWNDVPPTPGSAGTTIARATSPVPVGALARARIRFAVRPAADASPGNYRARLVFAVVAPG